MNSDTKNIGRPSTRDSSVIRKPNSPAIMASGLSTMFLLSDPQKLCDRLKLLLQEKETGNSSDISNEEIVAIRDKLLDYKCISKEQHKQFFLKIDLLHKKL